MKKILIILLLFSIGCSSDKENVLDPLENHSFSLDKKYGEEGDVLYLNGNNLDIKKDYNIFIGKYACSILEINDSFIKFQIPDICESGVFILQDGETSLDIEYFKIQFNRLFAIEGTYNNLIKIHELDINSGNVLNKFEIPIQMDSTFPKSLSYSVITKNLFWLIGNVDETYLFTFNLESEEIKSVKLNRKCYKILVNDNGNLYGYDYQHKIFEINNSTGNTTSLFTQIPSGHSIIEWAYDEINKEIIILFGSRFNRYFSVISNENLTKKDFDVDNLYNNFILTPEGRFFADNEKTYSIEELDRNNFKNLPLPLYYGDVVPGTNGINILHFVEKTKEFIGTHLYYCPDRFCDTAYIFRMDINSNIINEFHYESYVYNDFILTKFK